MMTASPLARMVLAIAAAAACALPLPAQAQSCGPDALGTARTLPLAPGSAVGSFQYKSPQFGPKEIALTFDDGPRPETTPKILDILKAQCVHATFFVVGRHAKAAPDILRREAAEGHTIGTHTWSHRKLRGLPENEAENEIDSAVAEVRRITGRDSDARLFRFPEFATTPQLRAHLAATGQVIVSADISPKDWAAGDPDETLARLEKQVERRGRGIVVLHDVQSHTVDFLPRFLTFLKENGYRVVQLEPAGGGERG